MSICKKWKCPWPSGLNPNIWLHNFANTNFVYRIGAELIATNPRQSILNESWRMSLHRKTLPAKLQTLTYALPPRMSLIHESEFGTTRTTRTTTSTTTTNTSNTSTSSTISPTAEKAAYEPLVGSWLQLASCGFVRTQKRGVNRARMNIQSNATKFRSKNLELANIWFQSAAPFWILVQILPWPNQMCYLICKSAQTLTILGEHAMN